MLTHLKIENVATIREFGLEPRPGFNVLSGETGAGKSIIVEALSLALGRRANRDIIRTGCSSATVVACFDLSSHAEARAAVQQCGPSVPDGQLVVRRELSADGRNKILMNGEPVTLAMLVGVGRLLGQVHGQHENVRLLDPSSHLEYLDAHGRCRKKVADIERTHEEMARVRAELRRVEGDERERARRVDQLAFQVEELRKAELEPAPTGGPGPEDEEDVRLEQEQLRLGRADEIREALTLAGRLIHDQDDAAVELVARSLRALEGLEGVVPDLEDACRSVQSAQLQLQDAARTFNTLNASIESSPGRLQIVESRLSELVSIKRKYGPELADARAYLADCEAELEALEGAGERRDDLAEELTTLAARFSEQATELRKLRRRASSRLTKELEAELRELGMPGARFDVSMAVTPEAGSPVQHAGEEVAFHSRGVDQVEFLFSANAGEELRPLSRVASGGEISRIMLALSSLLAQKAKTGQGVLVFDEVDAGVGGEAAETVGDRLAALASTGRQVFCVTHLAQVAARAESHHKVSKTTRAKRTETHGSLLTDSDRLQELARMLSGRATAAARKHAAELLGGRKAAATGARS